MLFPRATCAKSLHIIKKIRKSKKQGNLKKKCLIVPFQWPDYIFEVFFIPQSACNRVFLKCSSLLCFKFSTSTSSACNIYTHHPWVGLTCHILHILLALDFCLWHGEIFISFVRCISIFALCAKFVKLEFFHRQLGEKKNI